MKDNKFPCDYTATINYDAHPSDGYNYVVEINNEDYEVMDWISVKDDTDETIHNELKNFITNYKSLL